MRAILIDPFNESVTEVEHNGDYRNIYTLLSHETQPVDTFTVVSIDDDNDIFVDDNGLLNNPTHFFMWKGYTQPLAGKGLILAHDDEGESIGTTLLLNRAKKNVRWANDLEFVELVPFEDTIDHPILGPDTPRIGNRPVFTRKEKS